MAINVNDIHIDFMPDSGFSEEKPFWFSCDRPHGFLSRFDLVTLKEKIDKALDEEKDHNIKYIEVEEVVNGR